MLKACSVVVEILGLLKIVNFPTWPVVHVSSGNGKTIASSLYMGFKFTSNKSSREYTLWTARVTIIMNFSS